jgi:hypothetical protein
MAMTRVTAIYDWIAARTFGREAAEEQRKQNGQDFRIRPLPREEILLYTKRIDNTRVIRTVDNRDWLASLKMSGGVGIASVLVILLLLPGAYNLLASRQMERLRSERARLQNELKLVQVEEAKALNARRLKEWERNRFVEPTAASVIYAPPEAAVASLDKR